MPNTFINIANVHADAALEAFVERNGLQQLLDTACTLVHDTFGPTDPLGLRLMEDDEGIEAWVELQVVSNLDGATLSDAFDRFVKSWVEIAPQEDVLKIRISIGTN